MYQPSIQHWSHPPHLLHLTNPQTLTLATPCSGCGIQSSGWMYTCTPCNFTLHVACTQIPQTPQLINHPSYPYHPLYLLSMQPYPCGLFKCNGCGRNGSGFRYRCNQCDFDVHILCAQTQPQIQMQHYKLFPGENQIQNGNNLVHSQSMGTLQNYQVGRPAAPPPNNNNVWVSDMVHGFVQGAAQKVGQNLMQNVESYGGGGYGEGEGEDGSDDDN
ncbi:hypothetical protein EZV62_019337 [Acer yangbiense]|uniref:DC1 domain-containing protein n=1 Tax=Acer yangbiense TaxID=1000413 RepID=A0A5C7HAY0_9ROSI|nr:hypothetical protein EZV62_019337 [Acer yangbiense]